MGEQLSFKAWRLSPPLAAMSTVLMLAAAFGLLYLLLSLAPRLGLTAVASLGIRGPFAIATVIAAVALSIVLLRWTLRTFGSAGELFERATIGSMTVLLFVPMWIHLKVFDRIFLRYGRYMKGHGAASVRKGS